MILLHINTSGQFELSVISHVSTLPALLSTDMNYVMQLCGRIERRVYVVLMLLLY